MRPTERFGTFSSTSGGVEEVAEGADAIVEGIVREAAVEGVTEDGVGGGGPAAPTVKKKRLIKRARRARRDNIANYYIYQSAKMDVIGNKKGGMIIYFIIASPDHNYPCLPRYQYPMPMPNFPCQFPIIKLLSCSRPDLAAPRTPNQGVKRIPSLSDNKELHFDIFNIKQALMCKNLSRVLNKQLLSELLFC